jgi:hypothetical protein
LCANANSAEFLLAMPVLVPAMTMWRVIVKRRQYGSINCIHGWKIPACHAKLPKSYKPGNPVLLVGAIPSDRSKELTCRDDSRGELSF